MLLEGALLECRSSGSEVSPAMGSETLPRGDGCLGSADLWEGLGWNFPRAAGILLLCLLAEKNSVLCPTTPSLSVAGSNWGIL